MNLKQAFHKIPNCYYFTGIGWLSRIISALSKVIAINIVLGYLGTDSYAAFVLINGLLAWFLLMDFGLSKSLQNAISALRVNGEDLQILMSNAVILIWILIAVTLLIYSAIAYPFQRILLQHVARGIAEHQWYLLLVIGNIYIVVAILNVAFSVFFAEFRSYWVYIYQMIGAVGSVVAAIVIRLVYGGENRLFVMSLAWVLPLLVTAVVAYIHALPHKDIFCNFDFSIIKPLLVRSLKFWVYFVGSTLVLSSNYLIMSQTLSTHDITIFSILDRGFNVIYFVYLALLAVIWPELTELFSKQKWQQANKVLVKNMLVGMGAIVLCTVFFMFARHFIVMILAPGKDLVLPVFVIALFGVYCILRIFADTYAVGLQSQNRLKIFIIYLPFQAVLGVIGMYYLSKYFAVSGILFGLSIASLLTANWILPYVYKRTRPHHAPDMVKLI